MMVRAKTEVLPRRRFAVAELRRMVRAGVFGDDERLELIDGEVVPMAPHPGPRHCGVVDWLTRLFSRRCGDGCVVRVQNPLQLGEHDLFLPDLTLLRPRDDFYQARYPGPGDTLLAVEVADPSLYRDRKVKLPRYAGLGVGAVWILDLKHRCVHAFGDLEGGGYRSVRRLSGDELLAIPEDGEVAARDLLG